MAGLPPTPPLDLPCYVENRDPLPLHVHRGIIVPPSQPPYYSQGRGPCAFTCRGGKLAVPTPHTGPALLFIWQEALYSHPSLARGPYGGIPTRSDL